MGMGFQAVMAGRHLELCTSIVFIPHVICINVVILVREWASKQCGVSTVRGGYSVYSSRDIYACVCVCVCVCVCTRT